MTVVFALVTLFFLLLSGVPIAFSMGMTGLIFLYMIAGENIVAAVPQMMYVAIDSYLYIAIPLFLLASELMIRANVIDELIRVIEAWVGHWRGGLFTVSVVACAFFAAITGSSSATAVAIGSILVPEMTRRGYDKRYAMGLIAVAGGLGIVIPPSIPLIVYGSIAQESVRDLFIAGIVPGLILTVALIAAGIFLTRKDKVVLPVKTSLPERLSAAKSAVWVLLFPIIIAVGIYGGIFTPTEAAGVGAVYAYIIAKYVYKRLSFKDTVDVLVSSAGHSAMILLIIAGATVFGYVLSFEMIPQQITKAVLDAQMHPLVFLLIVNILFIILGMFLDITSIILLTGPIIIPIALQLGIDPVHFGIIFVINMELALITPPLGMNLFIISGIIKEKIAQVLKGALPFALVQLLVLVLVILFPVLSLILLNR